MAKRFIVGVPEKHYRDYEVFASSKEEALEIVDQIFDGTIDEENDERVIAVHELEFDGTMDVPWPVEEIE